MVSILKSSNHFKTIEQKPSFSSNDCIIQPCNLRLGFWTDHLIVNLIDYTGSIVDGPGIRTVLFVQGCDHKCIGCHNESTWDITKGRSVSINSLVNELRENVNNKKLTISGGEPLLQYSAVLELLKKLKDFNVVLYTGFEFENIPSEILHYLDYVKVGKYMINKRCTTVPYVGSSNQRFIYVGRGNYERNSI